MRATVSLTTVLVISESSVFREVLRLVLLPHSREVVSVGDQKTALRRLARDADVDLVISDTDLPDGSGFEVLQAVGTGSDRRPQVILVSARRDPEEAARADSAGAAGYLVKPISFRDIAGVLKRGGGGITERPLRRSPGGYASLLDAPPSGPGEEPQLLWYVRDLSVSGAFLETESPIPVGTQLDLALDLYGRSVRVRAEVIRVQEPVWGAVGGVGVTFLDLHPAAQALIESFVSEDPRSR